jgi:hypothetical protein
VRGFLLAALVGTNLEWQASLVGIAGKALALLAEEHPLKLGNLLVQPPLGLFFRGQFFLQVNHLQLLGGQPFNQFGFGKGMQVCPHG